jgi:hypothetical protein
MYFVFDIFAFGVVILPPTATREIWQLVSSLQTDLTLKLASMRHGCLVDATADTIEGTSYDRGGEGVVD